MPVAPTLPAEETAPSTPVVLREGDKIANRFRILAKIGEGGMGHVFAAEDAELLRKVAVKILHRVDDATSAARFVREARAASALRSEHAIRILDISTDAGGPLFFVMEYLEGEDLETVIQREAPLPIPVACNYILQACDAVAEAHGCGIVHRDLKPSNLFKTTRPNGSPLIKVLDFGISKLGGNEPSSQALTASRSVMGTPLYMSPEQLQDAKDVDARTDIWSLGVILYEMLTGNRPFNESSLATLCASVMRDDPVPARTRNPQIPEKLADAIAACMQRDRDQRPSSVKQLAKVLHKFADSTPQGLGVDTTGARKAAFEPAVVVQTNLQEATLDITRPNRKYVTPLAILGGVMVVALIVAININRPTPTEVVAPASELPAPSSPDAAVVLVPPATQVTIALRVTPDDATVELDGVLVRERTIRLPQSMEPKRLVVRTPGYVEQIRTFVPNVNGELVVTLEKENPTPAKPPVGAQTKTAPPTPSATPPPAAPTKSNKVKVKGPVESEL